MSYTFRGTPRHWLYAPHMKEQDKAIIICADDGTRYHRSIPVATIHEDAQHPGEGEANAHLIAAAPLLLSALIDNTNDLIILKKNIAHAATLNNTFEGYADEIQKWIDRNKAAIEAALNLSPENAQP